MDQVFILGNRVYEVVAQAINREQINKAVPSGNLISDVYTYYDGHLIRPLKATMTKEQFIKTLRQVRMIRYDQIKKRCDERGISVGEKHFSQPKLEELLMISGDDVFRFQKANQIQKYKRQEELPAFSIIDGRDFVYERKPWKNKHEFEMMLYRDIDEVVGQLERRIRVEKVGDLSKRFFGHGRKYYTELGFAALDACDELLTEHGHMIPLSKIAQAIKEKGVDFDINDLQKVLKGLSKNGLIRGVKKSDGIVFVDYIPPNIGADQIKILGVLETDWLSLPDIIRKTGWNYDRTKTILDSLVEKKLAMKSSTDGIGDVYKTPKLVIENGS